MRSYGKKNSKSLKNDGQGGVGYGAWSQEGGIRSKQGWEFAHWFSERITRFLRKNERMSDSLKKKERFAHSLIFGEQPE